MRHLLVQIHAGHDKPKNPSEKGEVEGKKLPVPGKIDGVLAASCATFPP
jgi:hypothetical protein